MPPLSAHRWTWVLSLCVASAAWAAGGEPLALCDARTLGAEAQREYESGVAALKREEARQAVPPLRRALVLEPRAAVARMVLGSALAKTGQTEAAAQEYAAFVSACPEHPRTPDILRLLADYERTRGAVAATAGGTGPSAPHPTEPVTLRAPAGRASARGAEALCDAAQLHGAVRARYEAGERHLKKSRYADAASALKSALEAEPRAAAAQLLLGTSYARLGQVDAGARAYASFVEACPEHPKAPTVRRLLVEFRADGVR